MLDCKPSVRQQFLQDLIPSEAALLDDSWDSTGRLDQRPPKRAADGHPWAMWLIMGGRGAGKTRTGAEWIRGLALGELPYAIAPTGRIALIAETSADARDVMVEGVSGILSVHARHERPDWQPSRRRLEWKNGAVAQVFSAEDPESLRGPQFECAWLDEFAKWRHAEETWDMLQFGLRLGAHPRQLITTTPRPLKILRRFMADPHMAVTHASTYRNAENLAPGFIETIVRRYAGTRLGRQELEGEIVEERNDALWSRAMIEKARCETTPPLQRVVVAIDPPASSTHRADKCGIVAAGIDKDGVVHVLEDASLAAARPQKWARAAIALYEKHEADQLVAEVNQGGDMVEAVIREADASVPVTQVRATRGKYLRAAPVALLYENDRVKHARPFPALEDEMCAFGPEGLPGSRSPDRLDALVWAITALALGKKTGEPRMRRL